MNKLTKVGCSALCGSLAVISSANAGDMTVTGGVDMTWISLDNATTGNPIGIGSNLTFKGSGELDNGWTWDIAVANKNASVYSDTTVDITMGGMGTLTLNQGDSGNGIAVYDDKMPTAWEEAWGAGVSTGIKTVVGVGGSNHIAYALPKVMGITLSGAYAPDMGSSQTADGASSGDGGTAGLGRGYDLALNINPSLGTEILSGLNLFAGGHISEKRVNNATYDSDLMEAVGGVTYDIGPISLGYGRSGFVMGNKHGTSATEVAAYKGTMYGVSFNVNDSLSVSYGYHDSVVAGYVHSSGHRGDENARKVEVQSTQIAYTMGGASLRLAESKANNVYFSSGTNRDAITLSVGLAF